jgi:hypothetical protein
MRLVVALAFVSAALLLIPTTADADWPKGYVVHENSESPDRQFGVVVPGSEYRTKPVKIRIRLITSQISKHMNVSARLQTPITSRDKITAT